MKIKSVTSSGQEEMFLSCLVNYSKIKAPLQAKMCFSSCSFIDVWALLCRMMYVQTVTLEGCFYIHLLKAESFIKKLIDNEKKFQGWAYECYITTHYIITSVEAYHGVM